MVRLYRVCSTTQPNYYGDESFLEALAVFHEMLDAGDTDLELLAEDYPDHAAAAYRDMNDERVILSTS